jgi:hypothetical protein
MNGHCCIVGLKMVFEVRISIRHVMANRTLWQWSWRQKILFSVVSLRLHRIRAIHSTLTTRSRVLFSVLKIPATVIRDLFLLWSHHRRSIVILHMGQHSGVTMIFMSLMAAMRTQAVTQILDIRIGMTRGWVVIRCSLASIISKWRKLKSSQSRSKRQSAIIRFAKPK